MNLLLFLAPMSAFNQVLAEDHSVNRLVRPPSRHSTADAHRPFCFAWDAAAVGLVLHLEHDMLESAAEQRDVRAAAEQAGPPGRETQGGRPVPSVCDELQGQAERDG